MQAAASKDIVVVADTTTVTLQGGATLDGLDVTNHGSIKVSGAATLKNDIVSNDVSFQSTVDPRNLHSFPTRRSSDLHVDGLGSIQVIADSTIDNTAVIDIATITIDDG